MKLSRTLGGCDNMIHGRAFPMNSVILQLDNGKELVCCDFHHPRSEPLELFCYLPDEKEWVKTYAKNKYTEIMWDYYRKFSRKQKKSHSNYMKSSIKHVKSSSKKEKGTRPVKIPSSVSWAMTHPLQGGRVSPR